MKKILCLLLLITSKPLVAQNLVPNPSFENYINCPLNYSNIPVVSGVPLYVEEWSVPTMGSCDFFHSCGEEAVGGFYYTAVPINFMGFQYARTGEAYAGGSCFGVGGDYREYLQVPLLTSMTAGHHYFVSMYVNLADRGYSWFGSDGFLSLDRLGMHLGTDSEERAIWTCMDDLVPQVESEPGVMLADTNNWTNISGHFTSVGGESWLIAGNFVPQDEVNYEWVSGGDFASSYYYYDDFCVLDLSASENRLVRDTVICPGTEIIMEGKAGMDYYLWDNNSTAPSRTISDTGTYWIVGADINTCTSYMDIINVKEPSYTAAINLGNDTTICLGDEIELSAGAHNDNLIYYWNTGSTASSITAKYPGAYHVTVTAYCNTVSDTIRLYIMPELKMELGNDINVCNDTVVRLGTAIEGCTYKWSTGDTTCCIDVTSTGKYSLTVENECGEVVVDNIDVVFANCDNCIMAPTAFSPNGDGLNDQFEVHVNCPMKNYKLSIFNRWGQLVFATAKPDKHWDGMMNGQPADVGVYFYYIEATPAIDELDKIVKKGDVTLVR